MPRKKPEPTTLLGQTKTVTADEVRKAAEEFAREQIAQADEPPRDVPVITPDMVVGEDVTNIVDDMLRTFHAYALHNPSVGSVKKTEARLIKATMRRLQKKLETL